MAYNVIRLFNKGKYVGNIGDLNFNRNINISVEHATGSVSVDTTSNTLSCENVYMLHNTAYSFVPDIDAGCLLLSSKYQDRQYTVLLKYILGDWYIGEVFSGDKITVKPSALYGTSGQNGRINVACANGRLYVENRTGWAQYIQLTVLGA